MKVLVVGSGGREHTLCWKLLQSPLVSKLYCAPGNPGMRDLAEVVAIPVTEIAAIVEFCVASAIELVVVGPELPLSLGLVDALRASKIPAFGPTRAAAQLEASKAFSKEVMLAAGVPTAAAKKVTSATDAQAVVGQFGVPVVLKADGLAAGKGVFVCFSQSEVDDAIASLYQSRPDAVVLIEEFLDGVEVSYIVCAHGESYIPLSSSHDYKRIGEGNVGLNTGGMGAVSPSPYLSEVAEQTVLSQVIEPVLRELQKRGTPFTGFLYAGLMVCPSLDFPSGEVKVLEFNARLGDPETQVLLPRLKSDLCAVILNLLEGVTPVTELDWDPEFAVCVVQASRGYPEGASSGDEIFGLDQAALVPNAMVFHAGTALNKGGKLCTNGGRVLGVVGVGATLTDAVSRSYRASDLIQFAGKQMRRDIGGSNGVSNSGASKLGS